MLILVFLVGVDCGCMAQVAPGGDSLNKRIIAAVAGESERGDRNAEEVFRLLPAGTNLTSVRSALARLASEGKIIKTKRGRYSGRIPDGPI